MAQSRIIDYDGTYVTYYYERHEDGKRIEEKIKEIRGCNNRRIKNISIKIFKRGKEIRR